MCGAAEYLDMHNRDIETATVLAHNGSSGDILASTLWISSCCLEREFIHFAQ